MLHGGGCDQRVGCSKRGGAAEVSSVLGNGSDHGYFFEWRQHTLDYFLVGISTREQFAPRNHRIQHVLPAGPQLANTP